MVLSREQARVEYENALKNFRDVSKRAEELEKAGRRREAREIYNKAKTNVIVAAERKQQAEGQRTSKERERSKNVMTTIEVSLGGTRNTIERKVVTKQGKSFTQFRNRDTGAIVSSTGNKTIGQLSSSTRNQLLKNGFTPNKISKQISVQTRTRSIKKPITEILKGVKYKGEVVSSQEFSKRDIEIIQQAPNKQEAIKVVRELKKREEKAQKQKIQDLLQVSLRDLPKFANNQNEANQINKAIKNLESQINKYYERQKDVNLRSDIAFNKLKSAFKDTITKFQQGKVSLKGVTYFGKEVVKGFVGVFVDIGKIVWKSEKAAFNYGRNLVKNGLWSKGRNNPLLQDLKRVGVVTKSGVINGARLAKWVVNNEQKARLIVGAASFTAGAAILGSFNKNPGNTVGQALAILFPGTVLQVASKAGGLSIKTAKETLKIAKKTDVAYRNAVVRLFEGVIKKKSLSSSAKINAILKDKTLTLKERQEKVYSLLGKTDFQNLVTLKDFRRINFKLLEKTFPKTKGFKERLVKELKRQKQIKKDIKTKTKTDKLVKKERLKSMKVKQKQGEISNLAFLKLKRDLFLKRFINLPGKLKAKVYSNLNKRKLEREVLKAERNAAKRKLLRQKISNFSFLKLKRDLFLKRFINLPKKIRDKIIIELNKQKLRELVRQAELDAGITKTKGFKVKKVGGKRRIVKTKTTKATIESDKPKKFKVGGIFKGSKKAQVRGLQQQVNKIEDRMKSDIKKAYRLNKGDIIRFRIGELTALNKDVDKIISVLKKARKKNLITSKQSSSLISKVISSAIRLNLAYRAISQIKTKDLSKVSLPKYVSVYERIRIPDRLKKFDNIKDVLRTNDFKRLFEKTFERVRIQERIPLRKPRLKQENILKPKNPLKKPPKFRIPRLNIKNLQRKGSRQGYVIRIKQGSRIITKTNIALPENRALNFMRTILDNTPQASGEIIKKGKTSIVDVKNKILSTKFRLKKGKNPKVRIQVEKKKYRLDKAGEKVVISKKKGKQIKKKTTKTIKKGKKSSRIGSKSIKGKSKR